MRLNIDQKVIRRFMLLVDITIFYGKLLRQLKDEDWTVGIPESLCRKDQELIEGH